MVSYASVIIVNTVSLVLELSALVFCIYVILKFIIQVDSKLFVTLHYAFAVPLLLGGIAQKVSVYVELPKTD